MATTRKTTKKAAAKKTAAKKAAKKTTARKTTAKKTTAKKATAKKAAAKKATAKKTAAKKTAKKPAAKKATAKKTAAKATAKKPAAKKAAKKAAKQAPAKKAAKKTTAKASAPEVVAPEAVVPAPAAAEPKVGDKYSVLKADYRRAPAADAINRVGGRPIGFDAASWPKRGGKPMHHVLTIDLKEHPAIVAQRFRALALFISSPMEHEAYTPDNDHARVILLTEEDVRRGVPEWPEGLGADDTLKAGSLRFESAAELTQKQLYQESFAGDDPIWLQGDESGYDDYGYEEDGDDEDDDGGDDDDNHDDDEVEDRGPPAPHIFVLQFDEKLVPGINLGDMGIMYVYADAAWFQCH